MCEERYAKYDFSCKNSRSIKIAVLSHPLQKCLNDVIESIKTSRNLYMSLKYSGSLTDEKKDNIINIRKTLSSCKKEIQNTIKKSNINEYKIVGYLK